MSNLRGQATVRFRGVSFPGFDPLQAAARATSWGELEPSPLETTVRSAVSTFQVQDRNVVMTKTPVEITGAKLELSAHYGFDGTVLLNVHADFRHLARRWTDHDEDTPASQRVADLHLAGSLTRLALAPEVQAAQAGQITE
jgi:hypothetical protein